MRAALAALLLLALLTPGGQALGAVQVRVEVSSAAPEALLEAAEALPLPAPPRDAPTVVVQVAPAVVEVVQAVAATLPPVAGPGLVVPEPLLQPDDVAALESHVAPAPAPVPAPAAEPYIFPRDEPVPPVVLAPRAPAEAMARPPEAPALPPATPALTEAAPAAALGGTLALLAAALYVRLAPGAALDSPMRRRVYDAVRADPGCTVNTVARALGIDYKTAQHHLRVLQRNAYLHRERVGGWERFFVNGALPPQDHAAAVVLRAPAARALAQALGQGSRARAAELARALGVSEATASVQLRRLAAAGLARKDAEGLWAAA